MLGVLPARATVFQWHHYTFSLPPSGEALAESEICLQAFRLDGRPAWGMQFHAEVTHAMVAGWVEEDLTICRCPRTSSPRSRTRGWGSRTRRGARSLTPSSAKPRASRRRQAPRETTHATSRRSCVRGTRALEHLRREPRPAPDVAVRDDLGALGQADESTHRLARPALEDALERDVHGAWDVTLARIAVSTGRTLELERRPYVHEGNAVAERRAARRASRLPLAHELEQHLVEPVRWSIAYEVAGAGEDLDVPSSARSASSRASSTEKSSSGSPTQTSSGPRTTPPPP